MIYIRLLPKDSAISWWCICSRIYSRYSQNVGIIGEFFDDWLFTTIDFWLFDLSDPIIVENYNAVLSAPVVGKTDYIDQARWTQPVNATTVESIETNVIKVVVVKTSGVDVQLCLDVTDHWTLNINGTYTFEHEVTGDALSDTFDAAGFLNTINSNRPIPKFKATMVNSLDFDNHNLSLATYYVSDYKDERNLLFGSNSKGQVIDSQIQLDLSYNYHFNEGLTHVNFTISSVTDKETPFACLDLNYDPLTLLHIIL